MSKVTQGQPRRLAKWREILVALAGASLLGGVGGGLLAVLGASPAYATVTVPTELYASFSGTGTACSTGSPCSITEAITVAEATSGAVVVNLFAGTYTSQVTIAPTSSSPMTSLLLTGPAVSPPTAIIEPSTISLNITPGGNGHFFDENGVGSGDPSTGAIIGVQTGSVDSAVGNTTTASTPAHVTLDHLGIDGSGLSAPATPYLDGIGFIDTSGTIENSSVKDILTTCSYCSAWEGVQVESNGVNSTVHVATNTVGPKAGLVGISAMTGGAGSGALSATITGNTLTGDVRSTINGTAEVGIAAGGTSSLNIATNTITDYQAPWNEAAIWLDSQAPSTFCSVEHNTLTDNDNGIAVAGASDCLLATNTISAGSTGIEVGQGFGSLDDVASVAFITGNTIDPTPTVATVSVYCSYDTSSGPCAGNAGSAEPTTTGGPLDGILNWDGTGTIGSNTIGSGFADGVYNGQDPNFFSNTTLEGFGLPTSYSGFSSTSTLNPANTCSDPTTVESGLVKVESSGGLGTGTVTVDNGATLELDDNGGSALSVANALHLGNHTTGTALLLDEVPPPDTSDTWSGAVTLGTTGSGIVDELAAAPLGSFTITGVVGGTGDLNVGDPTDDGGVALEAENSSYSGAITVGGGSLFDIPTPSTNIPLGSGTVTIDDGAELDAVNLSVSPVVPMVVTNDIHLGTSTGTARLAAQGPVTYSGSVVLGDSSPTVEQFNEGSNTTDISGPVTGPAGDDLTVLAAPNGAVVELSNSSDTYSGTTTIEGGTLDVTGALANSVVTVETSTATLEGTGSVAGISSNAGTVSPGNPSPGKLTLTGAADLGPTPGAFGVDITGTAPGSGYSQLSSTSTVALDGATLNVTDSYAAPYDTTFTIVTSSVSGTPVSGTFDRPAGTPLANGAVITSTGGRKLKVTYSANAVTLTDVTSPPSPPSPSEPTPPAAPPGSKTAKSATYSTSSAPHVLTDSSIGLTVTTTGTGSLTVAGYSANPTSVTPSNATGQYVDVAIATGSDFTSVTIKVCTAGAGGGLDWWNGTAWAPFSDETIGPTGCITATVTATTSPSIKDLTGTPIAVVTVPANRIAGQTADATAAAELETSYSAKTATAHDTHCVGDTAKTTATAVRPVVLATDGHFQDALSSQYLASYLKTGTLLTPYGKLTTATLAALKLEGVTNVDVVGGSLAISTAVVSQLEKTPAYSCGGQSELQANGAVRTIKVTRIFGQTQYDTAQKVAAAVPASHVGAAAFTGAYGKYNDTSGTSSSAPAGSGKLVTAIVASGQEFQDAEAASMMSYEDDLPILLTMPRALSAQAQAVIKSLAVTQVIVMGGPLAITNTVVSALEKMGVSVLRIAGKDATDTAAQLASFEVTGTGSGLGWTPAGAVTVARGNGYTDGLAGAVLEEHYGAHPEPLLLTESQTSAGAYLTGFLKSAGAATGVNGTKKRIATFHVLGGSLAVTTALVTQMETDLAH